jgi:antitoxin component of RelBE/YafQ-DinJ toxin-antitoxin module
LAAFDPDPPRRNLLAVKLSDEEFKAVQAEIKRLKLPQSQAVRVMLATAIQHQNGRLKE